jgi:desulfoferrodoxin (superoxide reductase-like protein)
MSDFTELARSVDWKTEKHAPAMECPDTVKAGEFFGMWHSPKTTTVE